MKILPGENFQDFPIHDYLDYSSPVVVWGILVAMVMENFLVSLHQSHSKGQVMENVEAVAHSVSLKVDELVDSGQNY